LADGGEWRKFLAMKYLLIITLGLGLLVAPACSPAASLPIRQNQNATNTAPSESKADPKLAEQIEKIAADAKGRVGVHALVLETGETVSLQPDEHFPIQSVYKLPISMAVLAQVDAGKLKLDQKVRVEKSDLVRLGQYSPIRDKHPNGTELTLRELIRFAVMESDGTASDVLMRVAGGAGPIQEYLSSIRVNDWKVLSTERELGSDWETQYRNWATPRAAVDLLRTLQEQRTLSDGSRALLVKFLTDSIPGEKRLKGLLPVGTVVAHKTGTSGSKNDVSAATNDIGIINLPNGHHLIIAVFVSDSPTDLAVREGVIARIARAVWDAWSKP
jgi:beta-lactamase class A